MAETPDAADADAADRVSATAPLILGLLQSGAGFLHPQHCREDPAHDTRNAITICPDGDLSLIALVWLPGQLAPVHDHGSWCCRAAWRACRRSRTSPRRLRSATCRLGWRPTLKIAHNVQQVAAGTKEASNNIAGVSPNLPAGTRRLINVPHYRSQ
jgi:hypothetical protein